MVAQGEIYSVDLSPTLGHEQAGLRPVIILQNNHLNRFLKTFIVIPLTRTVFPSDMMSVYALPKSTTGLKKDSFALLFQLRTLDGRRLRKKIGKVSEQEIASIKERVELLF